MTFSRRLLPLCTALASVSVSAQSATLEEVLVTAQKRVESAQDVPIAITAISGDTLEQKNILSATDLEKFTPGLRVPQQDISKTFIRIRGVGSRKFDIGSEGSVGIFVDEVYQPRFSGADIGLLDVERLEVLKGPQGTIFGRNTSAGAISVTTRRPTDELEGFLEGGVGNEDSYLIRAGISGPISDTVSMRLAAGQQEVGGLHTNTNTGDTDDRETSMVRWLTAWQPSDTLFVLATVSYNEKEQKAMPQKSVSGLDSGQIFPLFLKPGLTAFANDDLFEYPVTYSGGFDSDSLDLSLRIEKEFGELSLVSVTGYQDYESFLEQDFDAALVDVGKNRFDAESDTFSQEFRLVGDQWLLGVYYYEDDAFTTSEFDLLEDSLQALFQGAVYKPTLIDAPQDVETTSWAVFGEYRFDLTEKLGLTLGGRYSYDEKDFVLSASTNSPGIPPVFGPYEYADKEDWDSFDPKVALTYHATDDFMLYATYSEGYKAGGVQFTAFNQGIAEQLFDPEELSSYEIGFKSDLLGGSMRLNATAFIYDYTDLQVQRVDTSLSGGLPVAFTSNAAESDIEGAEIDLTWLPLGGLELRLAYAYLDATYQDFAGPTGEDFSGNPLPYSPENTVMFTANYVANLGEWTLAMGTDWVWADEFNFDEADDNPLTKQDDYTLGAAQVALTFPGRRLTVSAFVNNLTDEEYFTAMTLRSTEVIATSADGRRYGMRVKYEF